MALGDRKEAEMKPTPRSARMGAIADALMAARNFADKAQVPEAVPLIGGQGLGSLVLGKAPEELNEMSYGNMPMRINPLAGRTASYVPEMKAGRKEQVADLAMLAGVPRVGKAGVGLAGVGDVGVGAEKALITYHGTPHRFAPEPDAPLGAFKAEKIGSGEGAQAYGHGLYFAESPDIARGYRERLSDSSKNTFILGGKEFSSIGGSPEWLNFRNLAKQEGFSDESAALAYNKLKEFNGDLDAASGDLRWMENGTKIHDDAANLLLKTQYKPEGGSFYTVDIPDEMVDKMLDWDKPLKNKKEALKIFNSFGIDAKKMTGGEAYKALSDKLTPTLSPDPPGTPRGWGFIQRGDEGYRFASEELRKAGIPGIRYLDERSRTAGEGTRNIVVFPGEEKNIKILKRNEEEAPKFAKGGMMKPKINGFQDGGTAVEPTTGNDVPVGALPNEVADDIDAKLSEGEFVIPADVVRYIGLERLMKLRDDAKKGLQRMAQIGQMGNAEEVGARANSTFEGKDEEDTDQFESDIDEILAEETNGQTERMMATGGLATMPFATGTDLSKAPKNPVFDVRYLKHNDGRVMYITYVNGKPLTPIPEGFKETTQDEALKMASAADEAKKAAEKKTEPIQQQQVDASAGDGGAQPSTTAAPSMPGTLFGFTPMQVAQGGKALSAIPSLTTLVLGKGMQAISNSLAQEATAASMGAVADEAQAQAEAMGVTAPATSGMAASNAAVAAADTAINAGHSNAASIAAANAAASAINNGASASAAAQAGEDAAAATDAGVTIGGQPGMEGISDIGGPGISSGDVGSVGDIGGIGDVGEGSGGASPWAKGGLVGKRKPKAKRGKGIVAQK